MSSFTKKIALVFIVLLSVFFFVLSSHYSQERQKAIKNLTRITHLPGIALSTSFLESRVLYYEDFSNTLYPDMKNHSRMDFVYDK